MENAKDNLKIILKSIVIGGCGGFVVSMYRLCTSYAQKISLRAYHLMSEHFIYTILGILVFAIIGYVVGYSVEKEPMISGSGIPQIEGCLKGKLNIIHSFKILKASL
ncbi:hypothetical protein LEQ06_16065 [Paraclostridium sp. AKS46]|nr:hypothetical protein [Paraclostridium sp. AKS46]